MARGFNKTELKRLGERYAKRLLQNPAARVEAMLELAENLTWRELGQNIKKEVAYDIREVARGQLIGAGYNRETVTRVIGF